MKKKAIVNKPESYLHGREVMVGEEFSDGEEKGMIAINIHGTDTIYALKKEELIMLTE